MNYTDPQQTVPIWEIAERLGISESRAQLALTRGEIPVLALGKMRLCPRLHFDKWMQNAVKLPEAPPAQDRSAAVAQNVAAHQKNWAKYRRYSRGSSRQGEIMSDKNHEIREAAASVHAAETLEAICNDLAEASIQKQEK